MDRRDLITLAVVGGLAAGGLVAFFLVVRAEGSADIKFWGAGGFVGVRLWGARSFVPMPQRRRGKERATDSGMGRASP